MKTFKLICKGVLLYVTIFAVIIWICGIDSLYEKGYLIYSILILAVLIYSCYKTISEEELEILTFDKFFKNRNDTEI